MATTRRICIQILYVVAMVIPSLWLQQVHAQQDGGSIDRPAGLRLFLSTGCGACHRIAGTEAQGKIGPDLTHLAARQAIGANLLPMNAENLADWIRHTQDLKPGARMPSFGMLPLSETNAIVEYLVTLK